MRSHNLSAYFVIKGRATFKEIFEFDKFNSIQILTVLKLYEKMRYSLKGREIMGRAWFDFTLTI